MSASNAPGAQRIGIGEDQDLSLGRVGQLTVAQFLPSASRGAGLAGEHAQTGSAVR
ncbi:MAG: hypothetical protein R2856_24835 [Caldilineaceae bacterium]